MQEKELTNEGRHKRSIAESLREIIIVTLENMPTFLFEEPLTFIAHFRKLPYLSLDGLLHDLK